MTSAETNSLHMENGEPTFANKNNVVGGREGGV